MLIEAKDDYRTLQFNETDKPGTLGILSGILFHWNALTKSGRLYSKKLWENIINDDCINAKIENDLMLGHFVDAKRPYTSTPDEFSNWAVSLIELKLNNQENGVEGKFYILDTPGGRLLKTAIDQGLAVHATLDGIGDIRENFLTSFTEIDSDTYQLREIGVEIEKTDKTGD